MATTATQIEDPRIADAAVAPATHGAATAAESYASDEEILGIGDSSTDAPPGEPSDAIAASAEEKLGQSAASAVKTGTEKTEDSSAASTGKAIAAATSIPQEFEQIFAAAGTGPKLREIYDREAAYHAFFPTVDDARTASQAQRELARVDELFESGDPAAQFELIAGLAQRDPVAFRSLAATFGERLAQIDPEAHRVISGEFARAALDAARLPEQMELLARAAEKGDAGAVKFLAAELTARLNTLRMPGPHTQIIKEAALRGAAAQSTPSGAAAGKFVEAVNAEVEKSVEQAVGGRVADLLPDAPDATRRKLAADIYRELDAALKKDTALLQQVSANFAAARQAGQFSAPQRAAMAALVLSKAKAVLPGVAKRVVGEWTSGVMSASQARSARHAAAAARADVGVGGAPRTVSTQAPRVDYRKMSDEEILNADLP